MQTIDVRGLGLARYPQNIAALPPGARIKEEDMKRALKLAGEAPAMRELLGRIQRAGEQRDLPLLIALAEEAGGLVQVTGGAA